MRVLVCEIADEVPVLWGEICCKSILRSRYLAWKEKSLCTQNVGLSLCGSGARVVICRNVTGEIQGEYLNSNTTLSFFQATF